MKTVYRDTFIYTLNDCTFTHTKYGSWHYGELPDDYTHEYTLEDLSNYVCGYVYDKCLFSKKHIIRLSGCYEESIKEKDFINATTYVEHLHIKWNYTAEDLMKHLPADEFADWCKDKGICNICVGK